MRIAFITSHVSRRRELAAGPLDAEWIVDNQGSFDPVVYADYQSDGTDLLEQAGIPVRISPKRTALFADGTLQTAEELQARLLLDQHLERPFDGIIHDSARAVDWAWHEPRLGEIPRGVALGAGAVRDIRLVTDDAGLFISHGRRLWASTGPLAAADFLVCDVDPAEYGLAAEGLPPCYRLNELPTGPAAEPGAALVAVIAMSEDPAGLTTLVPRAAAAVNAGPAAVFAVVHPDIPSQVESTRDMILGGLPAELRDRVRLSEPSSDGVAEGWLAQADAVVCARPSDLAVRAVADAFAKVGGTTLQPHAPAPPPLSAEVVRRSHRDPPRLVPMEGPRHEVIGQIDGLVEETAVILYAETAGDLAQRMWRLRGLSRAGLVLACDAGPYLGEADPSRPAFNLLGFRMSSWPSIRRLMDHTETLHELVEAAAALSHAGRTDLLCLPARGVSHGTLAAHHPPLPAWVTDDGMLPEPNLAGISDRGSADGDGAGPAPRNGSVREWAETHGIGDRIRLALPWKWGLLNRAMKGRW